MLAMSSTSSSSHQPTNPFLASNLGGSSSSPWPLLLEDPLATLLPNYHNQHNLLATHFPPYQAFATHSSSHDHHHYHSSTSPPAHPPSTLPPFADLPDRQREDEEEEVRKDSSSGGGGGTVTTTMKKLNHNASERYRRKKINTLYSSLRAMLPPSDHHSATKKLSIPTTVSRVLKYIPELQQQVEALARKKEMLLSSSAATTSNHNQQLDNKQDHVVVDRHHMNVDPAKSFTSTSSSLASSPSTVSTSWLSEREVMVQISVAGDDTGGSTFQVSEILLHLQETGLVLVNSSSFRSFHGRVFYNLHLKVEGTHGVVLDREALSEKLLNLYEHRSF